MKGSVSGTLELICGPDSSGRPSLRRQFCEPPFHVGKGYVEGNRLTVQIANPAAGVFAGDILRSQISAIGGVHFVVKTPAATSFFPGPGLARVKQRINVRGGSWVEWLPQLMIPHAGARLRQELSVEVEEGASFLGVEALAPGRVARGETFAYDSIEIRTAIHVNGEAVIRERLRLDQETLWIVRKVGWEAPFFATIWVVAKEMVDPKLPVQIEAIQEEGLVAGATVLSPQAAAIRLAAIDSVKIRKGIQSALERLGEDLY